MADAKTKDGRDVTWISGGSKFEVTHYTYALENDPIHTGSEAEKIEAPGLGGAKYKRGFLGKKYGVGMQGTGLADDGKYIMYNGTDSSGNIKYKYGIGGAYRQITKPYEQIAVDKSVIPYGTQVYVENYPDKVMSADDCGGAIKGKHIDVFAGAVPIKTAYALGTKYGRVGIVSGTAAAKPESTSGKTDNASGKTDTASSATTGTGNEQVYTIKSGDTLSKIATKFNVAGGYKALAAFNNIADPNRISVGQKIRIPGTTAATTDNKSDEKKEETKTETVQPKTATVVVSSSLNIRSEPNTSCKILGSLHNGDKVTYTEDKNGWLRITSPKTGYISKQYTKIDQGTVTDTTPSTKEETKKEETPQAKTTTVVVSGSLNIRSEPNTSCKILGSLHNGDKVTYTEDKNGWLRITSPKTGYISKKYTKLNANASSGGTKNDVGTIDTSTIGAGGLHYLTTKQVAKADTGRKTKQIVDLQTKKAFNVSWDSAPGYHSDCTPMTSADTTVFKSIRDPSKSADDPSWKNTSSWSWTGRPAAIQLKDGRWVACGYHQRPHAAIMGGNPGSPFQNQSNTKPSTGWAMGGHFCLYYGDSPGGTQDCNRAAKDAKDMSL